MIVTKNNFIGIFLAVLYVLIGASQSVALNVWLRDQNTIFIIGFSFLIISFLFYFVSKFSGKNDYHLLKSCKGDLILLNVFSALNWIFYFLSVKFLVPSLAVTFIQGVGPLIMTVYMLFLGKKINIFTKILNILIFITICYFSYHTFLNYYDYSSYNEHDAVWGLVMSLLCGASISASIVLSKKIASKGLSATSLLSVRFFVLILFSIFYLFFTNGFNEIHLNAHTLFVVFIVSVLGVSLSIFVLQKGIEFTTPLVISTILALAPFTVFIIERIFLNKVGNLFSFSCLSLVVVFSVLSIYSNKRN